MEPEANQQQIDNVVERVKSVRLNVHISIGEQCTLIGVIGDRTKLSEAPPDVTLGVERIMPKERKK